MLRVRTFPFKKILLLYSLVLTLSIVVISISLLYVLKPSVPNDVSNYYISGDIINKVEPGWLVSVGNLSQSVISSKELQTIFLQHYLGQVGIILIGVFVLVYVCSLLLSNYLNVRVKQPIAEIANQLDEKNDTHRFYDKTMFPKEFKTMEEAFEKAMKDINGLKVDFDHLSHYVSHEQKNALATLRAKLQNGNEKDMIEQIDRMVQSLDNILTICVHHEEDLNEVTDLSLVCGSAVDEYRKIYQKISYEFDEECFVYVHGREVWIYRAICNLIDNAIKYGTNSTIHVEVGINHNCPFVSVSDGGIGIPIDQQEKIFMNGYRIGNLKKDGYGIGLSLVKHVAKLCNGFVWVESDGGRGSTFKIIFPLCENH